MTRQLVDIKGKHGGLIGLCVVLVEITTFVTVFTHTHSHTPHSTWLSGAAGCSFLRSHTHNDDGNLALDDSRVKQNWFQLPSCSSQLLSAPLSCSQLNSTVQSNTAALVHNNKRLLITTRGPRVWAERRKQMFVALVLLEQWVGNKEMPSVQKILYESDKVVTLTSRSKLQTHNGKIKK